MTRSRLPLAFYLNAVASALFFTAIFVSWARAKVGLQWLGGIALAAAVVALAMRK